MYLLPCANREARIRQGWWYGILTVMKTSFVTMVDCRAEKEEGASAVCSYVCVFIQMKRNIEDGVYFKILC